MALRQRTTLAGLDREVKILDSFFFNSKADSFYLNSIKVTSISNSMNTEFKVSSQI